MIFDFKKTPIILITILFGGLLLSGCENVSPISQSRPAYSVTVPELAARLGLTTRQTGKPYCELSNSSNTVRLFLYDGGRVYVNGNEIGTVGIVQEVGGEKYVPELLIPKIRGALVSATPVKTWNLPTYPTPTARTGSGVVVIDPGHGGKDPGAQSVLGYWEKEVNFKICQKLISYLRQAGVTVHTTREGDTYPTLEERAAMSNRLNADLFVSVHCNSIHKPSIHGFIVFTSRNASQGSKKAARLIEQKMSNAGIYSRGIQKENYRVLVKTDHPAVLVECGFMSNYDEAALLMDPWYQSKLARAIADGIIDYL